MNKSKILLETKIILGASYKLLPRPRRQSLAVNRPLENNTINAFHNALQNTSTGKRLLFSATLGFFADFNNIFLEQHLLSNHVQIFTGQWTHFLLYNFGRCQHPCWSATRTSTRIGAFVGRVMTCLRMQWLSLRVSSTLQLAASKLITQSSSVLTLDLVTGPAILMSLFNSPPFVFPTL